MSPPAAHRTAEGPPGRRAWPAAAHIAVVAVAYFALARLGLCFATITANTSPIWPPSGLALGALIVGGLRLWPGVACGALAAAISAGAPPWAAVAMAAGNTLEPVVTVVLLRRLFGFQVEFEQPRHVVGFVLLHGAIGAPLSAALGTGALWLCGAIAPAQAATSWLTWWGGNFTGGVVLGPLLIAARQITARVRPAGMLRELAISEVLLVLIGGTVFVWGPRWGLVHPALIVLPFPVLIWIAWRFAIGGAALSLLLLSALAVWGAAQDGGPFAAAEPFAAYGYLLAYFVVAALTALVLAAFNVQREQIVARLRQREQQLSEAQRIGNLGMWVWDQRTNRLQLSDGALRLLGAPAAPLVPTLEAFLDRVHPDDRPTLEALRQRVRGADGRETCDVRLRHDAGSVRHVTIACSALRNAHGEALVLLGTLLDFTERKHYEDEQAALQRKLLEAQKLESLGLLAGGIAHDFNNLFTGILGNASLLRLQLPATSPMHEGLRRIEHSTERAADLCRQMLAYSGKGRFVVRTIELNELVRSTLTLAQNSVPKKADVAFDPAGAALRVRADQLQLRQLLLNLVLNAAEALPDSGGRVVVRTGVMPVDRPWLREAYLAPDLAAGEYVFLEVEDTGGGIAPELQTRIFDPFFSTKFTGRGLGLAAVAGIVRAHRGAIRVASQSGRGAAFRVVLPPAPAEPAPAGAAPAVAAAAPLAGEPQPRPLPAGSAPVLVVDDEATIRQVAADVLTQNGIPATTASDGLQALELFAAPGAGFRAVLLDFSMPRLDGVETLKRLRARQPDIAVVLMSGFEAEEALERFAGLGISGFLQKPFTPAALLAAMAKAHTGA